MSVVSLPNEPKVKFTSLNYIGTSRDTRYPSTEKFKNHNLFNKVFKASTMPISKSLSNILRLRSDSSQLINIGIKHIKTDVKKNVRVDSKSTFVLRIRFCKRT